MEAWLAELEMEMEMNKGNQKKEESEILMEAYFDEEIAATLGEEFPYPICPSHENNKECRGCSQWELDYEISDEVRQPSVTPNIDQNQPLNGGRKRKRQPSQVQDHIIAERRRRELLAQLFISLSAILPGLKKTDKTSVLGEAIKYMKQLKEKVKVLEEMAAKRTVESMVVVKKSQLMVDNVSGDENESSCTMDHNGSDLDLLPEIEAKISENTLLLRLYCESRKGILSKLFAQIDSNDLSILSCSVIPFESLALDITIAAQMKTGFNANIKAFVRNLHSSLR